MKTIDDLNQKIWYRIIKVIYIMFFVSTIGIFSYLMIESFMPKFDYNSSYIQCDDKRKVFVKENNIFVDDGSISDFYDEKIKSICAYNSDDPININPDNKSDLKRLNPNNKNYSFVAIYTKIDWFKVLFWEFIILIVNFSIAELMKRIFYYIALGKIIPNK